MHTGALALYQTQPSYFAHIVRKYIRYKYRANYQQAALLSEAVEQNEAIEGVVK